MTPARSGTPAPDVGEVQPVLQALLVAAKLWARGVPVDHEAVAATQDRALVWLHGHYVASIPVYAAVARRDGLEDVHDPAVLAAELMLTSDVFKSYDPEWLDDGDFAAMTDWLGTLFVRRPALDPTGVTDVATWRAALRRDGVYLTWSSGTSGRLSFVPRDAVTLRALRANATLATPRAAGGDPPGSFACLALTERGLGLGIQSAAQGAVERAARSHHLDLPGPGAPQEAVDGAWHRAVAFLAEAAADGMPVTVVGTPLAVHALCRQAGSTGGARLPEGSTVVTGGGWKGATAVAPGELRRAIGEALGVPDGAVVDVYGAAELNCYLVRCPADRYHVPPLVRVVALDDQLSPLAGDDVTGLLGFLDPFALSYPGFVVPGDRGRLVRSACACGVDGWAVAGPIERAPDHGVRGCATVPAGPA